MKLCTGTPSQDKTVHRHAVTELFHGPPGLKSAGCYTTRDLTVMYLRRNKVRCGESRRTYLSIAHNVWWSGEGNRRAQSRPIVVASFGVEDNVDVELARDLVEAVEKCAPKFPSRRGEGKAVTMRIAQEVRKIEPFLKALASRKLGLAQHLPPHPERAAILEALIRDRLAEPTVGAREEDILTSIKTRFGGVAA